MVDIDKKKRAYIKAETTYGVEAGSTDGSDMVYLDCYTIGELNDGRTVIDTPQASGRFWPTDVVAGPDGGSIEIKTPLIGLNGAAISGSSPPSNDWLDILLLSVFGDRRQVAGTIATAVASSSITFSPNHGRQLQDVSSLYAAGQAYPDRSQPVLLYSASSANTFSYAPALEGTPPANTVCHGFSKYEMSESGSQGTRSFTMAVAQDATIFTLRGCRPTSLAINVPTAGNAECSWTIGYDSKTEQTSVKTALPSVSRRNITPIQGFGNGFWFNGTKYAFRSMNIAFNLKSQNVADQSATNGRGSIDLFGFAPEISVEPLFSTTLLSLKRAATSGRLLLQLGAGISGSSAAQTNLINDVVISCNAAQISKADPVGDDNIVRHGITIKPVDAMVFSGSSSDFMSITRY